MDKVVIYSRKDEGISNMKKLSDQNSSEKKTLKSRVRKYDEFLILFLSMAAVLLIFLLVGVIGWFCAVFFQLPFLIYAAVMFAAMIFFTLMLECSFRHLQRSSGIGGRLLAGIRNRLFRHPATTWWLNKHRQRMQAVQILRHRLTAHIGKWSRKHRADRSSEPKPVSLFGDAEIVCFKDDVDNGKTFDSHS